LSSVKVSSGSFASLGFPKGGVFEEVDSTRDLKKEAKEPDETLTLDKRIAKIKGEKTVLVSVHLGNRAENRNYVRAYVDAHAKKKQESLYLACRVLNAFVQDLEVDGITPIVVDLQFIANDDSKQILQASDVGVYLEIGTIENDFVSNIATIGDALKEGLKEYKS